MTMKSFTYRFITLISLLFTICYTANGQYKDITIEKSSHLQLKIVQIDFREFSTFIHFAHINSVSAGEICAPEEWIIQDKSTYKKYKLLNSINLPLCPTWHNYGKGENHNFTLEFEKVPSDIKSFDILGNEEEDCGGTGWCFYNVNINPGNKTELSGYQKQLAKPYLKNKEFDENMLQEAYERMKRDIKASHILIKIDEKAPVKEEKIAYDKILSIRSDIMANKISFTDAAKKNSDDKSAIDNGGNLSYFTAFMMVYDFESAAYSTEIGEISMPIKTKYGYHIIKVTDKREAVGIVKVAHIMFKSGKGADEKRLNEAKDNINKVAELLNNGEEFADVAERFSEDRSTAVKGGSLPAFGVGKMVSEFETVAFDLKEIDAISAPFRTEYGWHIITLLERNDIPSFEEIKSELKRKIEKDSRGELSKQALYEKLKVGYNEESFIDIRSFTEQTPVKESGTYYKDGSAIQYTKHKDLIVSTQATWSRNHGRYLQIDISIQNLTGRDQLFSPNAITATFQIGEEVVDHEVLSHEEYMKKVGRNQFWQGIAIAAIEGAAAGVAGHSSSTTSYSSTSSGSASGYVGDDYGHVYGSSTTYGTSYSSSYNGAAAYAAQQNANRNVEEFTDKQYQIKHQLSQGYAKLHTINNETEYLGYVNIKAKKSDMKAENILMEVTIPLNNTNFIFYWY